VLAGRYAIEHLIGMGTFGWVLSALDLAGEPPRRVAIKMLRPRYAHQAEFVRRFERRELSLLLRVQELSPTPHVVRAVEPSVLKYGSHPYLVLEFIDGPSLRDVLGETSMAPERVLYFGACIARGLAAIHSAGGVHRDLKPANIRLRGGRDPVIVDLGINRALWETQDATETGLVPMTPRYASPEQRAHQKVGPESDIYSLGLILYEMLTGDVPVVGENLEEALTSRRASEAPGLLVSGRGIPREMIDCVLRCLRPRPEQRPTAWEVAETLSARDVPSGSFHARGRWLVWGVASLIALLVGALILLKRSQQKRLQLTKPPSTFLHQFNLPKGLSYLRLSASPQGNVFVTGAFQEDFDLGTKVLKSSGSHDVFVARFDPAGKLGWADSFGDASWQAPSQIVADPSGGWFVGGVFEGTINKLGPPLSSLLGKDIFLARFDAEGHPLWRQGFGGVSDQTLFDMALTPQGEIVLTGNFHAEIKLGYQQLKSAGLGDFFLAWVDSDGGVRETRRLGNEKMQTRPRLAVGRTGKTVMTGFSEGPTDLGSGREVEGNFVVMLDSNGHQLRFHPLDKVRYAKCCVLDFDTEDHFLLAAVGALAGTSSTLAVDRFDFDGGMLWSQQLGRFEKSPELSGIATLPDGRIILMGTLSGSADFGDGPFSGLGGTDLFLLELTSDGVLLSARRFGAEADQRLLKMVGDGWGNIVLAVALEGHLDLGNGLLTSEEKPAFILARWRPPSPLPPRGPGEPRCVQPPADLVAWYGFEDLEFTSLVKTAPQGSLVGSAQATPGRGHTVLNLKGGFFEVPDSGTLDFGRGPFSISAWIRTTDLNKQSIILDKRSEVPTRGNVPGRTTGYSLYLSRGRLSVQLADGIGHESCSPDPDFSCTNDESGYFVADGAWHLVTVTVDRASHGGGTFYVDGRFVASFDPTRHPGSIDNDHPLRIGSRSSSETGLFQGLIESVALWKRVLSLSEVKALYEAGSAGMCGS
jgi:serine/threonine-protein kinase